MMNMTVIRVNVLQRATPLLSRVATQISRKLSVSRGVVLSPPPLRIQCTSVGARRLGMLEPITKALQPLAQGMALPFTTALTTFHEMVGMPWWATIAVTSIGLRFLLVPFLIGQTDKTTDRFLNTTIKVSVTCDVVLRNRLSVADGTEMSSINGLLKDNKCSVMDQIKFPLLQSPLYMGLLLGIRQLTETDVTMTTGGFSWIRDLSVHDPYYILPMISTASMWIMFKKTKKVDPVIEIMTRVMVLASLPLAAKLPVAMFFMWIPSTLYSMLASTILNRPKIYKALIASPPPTGIQFDDVLLKRIQTRDQWSQLSDRLKKRAAH